MKVKRTTLSLLAFLLLVCIAASVTLDMTAQQAVITAFAATEPADAAANSIVLPNGYTEQAAAAEGPLSVAAAEQLLLDPAYDIYAINADQQQERRQAQQEQAAAEQAKLAEQQRLSAQKAAEQAAAARQKAEAVRVAQHKKTPSKAGKKYEQGELIGYFSVTAYCNCAKCQGKWVGTTALGHKPQVGYTIAVDPKIIKLGSKVYIENLGVRMAQDTGGAIKGKKIDVFMGSHAEAQKWGRQVLAVYAAK